MECPLGLDVRLVKTRPCPVSVFWFKLCVEVVTTVFGIAIAMQSLPRCRISTLSINTDSDFLVCWQFVKVNPLAIMRVWDCDSINTDLLNNPRAIDEKIGGGSHKRHMRTHREMRLACRSGQIEGHINVSHLYGSRALTGIFTGQDIHGAILGICLPRCR